MPDRQRNGQDKNNKGKETMSQSQEQKFIQALNLCQSLVAVKYEPSSLPCQAIELFCEVSKEPSVIIDLLKRHSKKVKSAFDAVDEYARSADNWRVKGNNCSLGFGVKDHCSMLSFFLNLNSQKFQYFTDNFDSSETICEFLRDWKGIDLTGFLPKISDLLLIN